jgi:hypothetical protein
MSVLLVVKGEKSGAKRREEKEKEKSEIFHICETLLLLPSSSSSPL